LKVLTGQYTPSKALWRKEGKLPSASFTRTLLGFDTEDSILEVAMGAFERVKQLEKEIEDPGGRTGKNR
jgi:ATP-binding cassette subfamily F protein 3